MKRRITNLVIFLFLGTIVNVAIAWGFSLGGTPSDIEVVRGLSRNHPPAWFFQEFTRSGFRRISIQVMPDRRPPFDFLLDICGVINVADMKPPSRFKVPPSESLTHGFQYQGDAAGWPLLSVNCEREGQYDRMLNVYDDEEISGGFILQPLPPNTTDYWRDRALPYRPIWPGFVINTLLYAVLLWMLTIGPYQLRCHIRHNRGSCIKCGYDLHHADHKACPECGAEIPS